MNLNKKKIDVIFTDFDGVLTDNKFYLNANGDESVRLNRSDGLAFDYLNNLKIPIFIISTEKNIIVKIRAKKLKIKCHSGVADKKKLIIKLCNKYKYSLSKSIYIGNDLNDLSSLQICKYSFCPKDSNKIIKKNAKVILNVKGGEGVIRNLVDNYFNDGIRFLK
jgi:3-deoxy-D-manno-octulosonate 8-phosphate phosphatase (KDO 8-P phosphatase)